MYTITVLCLAVAAASAATPFFESPHNPHASAFYKTPAHGGHYSGPPPAPAYQPSPSYHSQPAPYRPAPAPYRPAPAPYQPSHGGYSSGGYGGHGSYGGHGGATSFQTVRLGGGGDYGHHGSHY